MTCPRPRLPHAAIPSEPYCHIRFRDGDHTVRGLVSFHVGHSPGARDCGSLGPYGSWDWDGQRLSVRNDRYGLQPLYYYQGHNEICVATSIDTLLRHGAPTELDEPALAVHLRLGSFLGSDTPFRHISALPPDARLVWTGGRLELSGGFEIRQPLNLSEPSAIDAYIDLFRQAMKRRLVTDERVVLPLSGGRDSRHILLELCRLGHAPDLVITIDLKNSNDAEVAREIAHAHGIAQTIVPETELSLHAYRRLLRETSFNLSREIGFFVMADHFKERDVIYDGIGGDVLSAGLFLTKELLEAFATADWSESAKRLFPPQIDEALAILLQPEQYRRFSSDVAVERLSQELPRHRHAANPVGSFVFWNRTRRSIAAVPLCIMAKEQRIVFTPYLDDELFDFLSGIPASLLLDHQFHTKAIVRAFPNVGAITFSEKKAADTVRRDGHIEFARQLALAFAPRSRYVSMAYVWPRLLRSFVDPGYRQALEWFGPATVYLRSLESLDRGRSFSPMAWRKVSSHYTANYPNDLIP